MVSPRLFARRAIRDLDALRVVAEANDRSTVLDLSACRARTRIFVLESANILGITIILGEMLDSGAIKYEVH